MKKQVAIIRIDPYRRTIARILMESGRSAAIGNRAAKRILKATHVGFRKVMELEPVALAVAGRLDVTETMPGWRFAGSEDTAGISFLFGQGDGGGMTDVPVDVDWVRKRIIWLECEYVEAEQDAAE